MEPTENCFVCGKNNPSGLHLDFTWDEGERSMEVEWLVSGVYQGYDGILHLSLIHI